MKNILFLGGLFLLAYCQPTTITMEDYTVLPADTDFKKWVDKKVAFEATLAEIEAQHMLRPSLDGASTYIVVEPADKYGLWQILAYTIDRDNINKKYKGKTFTVYGTLGVVSGAGKGGGTHTEYYLELDKVE